MKFVKTIGRSAAVSCLFLAINAFAAAGASRGSISSFSYESEVAGVETGVLELNPDRDAVTTSEGISSVSSIRVDADRGVVGGYVEIEAATAATIPLGRPAESYAAGVLTSPLSFTASFVDPYTVVAEFSVSGSFASLVGMPSFTLGASISALTTNLSDGSAATYESYLSFFGAGSEIETAGGGSETHYDSGIGPTVLEYSGATFDVISNDPGSLQGVARLSFKITPDTVFMLQAEAAGDVLPEVTSGITEAGFEVAPSQGVLDFSHTANLTLYVPEGVEVTGDSMVANIVQVVPEPNVSLMLCVGLGVLTLVSRRKRRHRGETDSGWNQTTAI